VKARPDSHGFTTAHAARVSLATRRKNRPRGEVLLYAYPTQIEAMGHEHHGYLYNWCTPDEELPEGAEILERVNTSPARRGGSG
jgi:hypothetical protein